MSGGVSVSVHFSSVVYIRLAGRNGEQQGRFACHGVVYGGSLRSVVHPSVWFCAGKCTARAWPYLVTQLDDLSPLYWDLCIDHISNIQGTYKEI